MASLSRVVEKIRARRGIDWARAPGSMALWPREPAPIDVPEICSRYPTMVLFCGAAAIGAVLVAFVSLVIFVAACGASALPATRAALTAPPSRGPTKMKPRPAANVAPIENSRDANN